MSPRSNEYGPKVNVILPTAIVCFLLWRETSIGNELATPSLDNELGETMDTKAVSHLISGKNKLIGIFLFPGYRRHEFYRGEPAMGALGWAEMEGLLLMSMPRRGIFV